MALFAAIASASLVGFGARMLLAARFPTLSRPAPPSRRSAEVPRRTPSGLLPKVASLARSIVPASRQSTDRLRLKLAQAGLKVPAPVYHGFSVAMTACGIAMAAFATPLLPEDKPAFRLIACLGIAGIAACTPRALLDARARARKKEVDAALPATLEMLAVAVEAGLTLERAIRSVSKRRSDALAQELAVVDEDISLLGYTRDQSLGRLAQRCGSEDLALFASAVSVSSKAGAPIAAILKRQAAAARTRRFQHLEAEANKIPTKMIFPLAFLVMPGVFIIAVSPAVISIVSNASEVF